MTDDTNPYLQQEVLSASPLRLRWMLIQRAEELCGEVDRLWREGQDAQAAGWLLRIREILGELLGGVRDQDNPISRTVSDLYVFFLKLLNQVEKSRDTDSLKRLSELLHIENETWQQVVHKHQVENSGVHAKLPPSHFKAGDSETSYLELTKAQTAATSPFESHLHESIGGLNLEV